MISSNRLVSNEKNDTKVFSIDELKSCLFPVFENYNIKKAILFGSYSKGNATFNSDVDILVDSDLHGLKFVGFIEDIRNSLQGKEVDVFDISHVEKDSFVEKEIKETGVEIYAK